MNVKNRVEIFVGYGFGSLLGCALSLQKKMVAKHLIEWVYFYDLELIKQNQTIDSGAIIGTF